LVTAENSRLADADAGREPWRQWGPYLAERAWATVREDYSPDGSAWDYFPHDHARSRAYRWSEDGLAGICDDQQRFCFALALWNGVDPILKERLFGLTGPEGNHGEDVKEYWWYLDSTPTHSWMSWRYHYPQAEFPYLDLVETNRNRGADQPEYELVDTGVFAEDRYWCVTADYAKAGPRDLCIRIRVENKGPDEATLHLLPTLWFRNTWAWGLAGRDAVPVLAGSDARLTGEHPQLGRITLIGDGDPTPLACDNESNAARLWGTFNRSPHPKDAINDHVVNGVASVNPECRGTKGSLHYVLTVPPKQVREVRLRLTSDGARSRGGVMATDTHADLADGFAAVMAARETEADEFFTELTPSACSADEALVLRQAVAGLMWSKQFYHFNVDRWLRGDPTYPAPAHRARGRNGRWSRMSARDVIAMPDTWEYPWFAAWDLAFHSVALARVDPAFAKRQLLVLLDEWYMHSCGQIPAYEWSFDDDNPPVHVWAALQVFALDGGTDLVFLKTVFHKLLMNFTWWVNHADSDGDHVFEGGFLGLDNIGPFDRDSGVPAGTFLQQSDGTAWMAMYTLNLMDMALVLARHDPTYEALVPTFFEHFALIAEAAYRNGLWSEDDGFFYDVLKLRNRSLIPVRVKSVVGLLPLSAATSVASATLAALPELVRRVRWYEANIPRYGELLGGPATRVGDRQLLAMVGPTRLRRLLDRMLNEEEFLSDHGLRALSRAHLDHQFSVTLNGVKHSVGYEPAESRSVMFGGNSNWRGPVWFPVNYMLIDALDRYHDFFGDDWTMPYPAPSGPESNLRQIADDLAQRLVSLFLDDADGNRPVFGEQPLFQRDTAWHDLIPFHEYFHGDTGAGLGASHQTGWTALVINLILRKSGRRR
jgi:hypothetical protein